MFEVITTNQFLKGYKRCMSRNLDISLLDELIITLGATGTVPAHHRPHMLTGIFKGHYECHVKPDWLLIWTKDKKQKVITLVATGSHSDLFR